MAEEQVKERRARDRNGRPSTARARLAAKDAMRSGRAHLRELTGKEPETVVRIEADDDGGWRVALEVVELERIPNTSDVLGCYELQLDDDGELVGYRRLRRYTRSEVGEEAQE
jgi:hypothetical protein